jgi:hypothetical protein
MEVRVVVVRIRKVKLPHTPVVRAHNPVKVVILEPLGMVILVGPVWMTVVVVVVVHLLLVRMATFYLMVLVEMVVMDSMESLDTILQKYSELGTVKS